MSITMSGTVSIGAIREELLNIGTKTFSLKNAGRPTTHNLPGSGIGDYVPVNQNSPVIPNSSSPYQISEWKGYNHSQHGTCSGSSFTTPDIQRFYTYHKIKLTGSAGFETVISVQCNSAPETRLATAIYVHYPFTNVGGLTSNGPIYTFQHTSATTLTYTFTMSTDSTMLHVVSYEVLE